MATDYESQIKSEFPSLWSDSYCRISYRGRGRPLLMFNRLLDLTVYWVGLFGECFVWVWKLWSYFIGIASFECKYL